MKPRSRSRLALEALESRLAPAITIVNATTATFTDACPKTIVVMQRRLRLVLELE